MTDELKALDAASKAAFAILKEDISDVEFFAAAAAVRNTPGAWEMVRDSVGEVLRDRGEL